MASPCTLSLRTINAQVDDDSHEAIQLICHTCLNLISLTLRNGSYDLDGDFINQSIAQHCPLIESMSTKHWTLTDAGLDTLATIHTMYSSGSTLKQPKVFSSECTSAALKRVVEANPYLRALKVANVDDGLVSCIGRCCGNLKRLALYTNETKPLAGSI